MAKSTTILETFRNLKRKLDENWTEELTELGIWDEVAMLYADTPQRRDANIIVAYIVFAYHSKSEYIDPFKDRLENKRSIMMRLGGKDCFSRELFLDAVLGGNAIIDEVIEFFINDQRDWRWSTIISNMEFASKVTAKSRTEDFKESADWLELADKRRDKADKLLEEIREEFVALDSVLEKEGKPKITERTDDFMSWELYNHKRKFAEATKAAEEKERSVSKKRTRKDELEDSPI
jgi:hypothetical protein